jgi:hypothetical protein
LHDSSPPVKSGLSVQKRFCPDTINDFAEIVQNRSETKSPYFTVESLILGKQTGCGKTTEGEPLNCLKMERK